MDKWRKLFDSVYVIGITSYSGAGKSSMLGWLAENPRVHAMRGNEFRNRAAQTKKTELQREFGNNIFNPNDGLFDVNYLYTLSEEQRLACHNKLVPFIERELYKEISKMAETGKDIFVIEWALLPMLENVWGGCHKVFIDSKSRDRAIRLGGRADASCETDEAKERDRYISERWGGEDKIRIECAGSIIDNTGTMQGYKRNVMEFWHNTLMFMPRRTLERRNGRITGNGSVRETVAGFKPPDEGMGFEATVARKVK